MLIRVVSYIIRSSGGRARALSGVTLVLQSSAVQPGAVYLSSVQSSAVHYVQYSEVQFTNVQNSEVQCSSLVCTAGKFPHIRYRLNEV